MATIYQIQVDDHGVWGPDCVFDATYDTREEAESAIEYILDTRGHRGYSRDTMRIVEVEVDDE